MVLIIVCIIAGLGAGIGTGLAGLSAAVVITPMLITFCGFTAYEAVGIALASDVLASAATAYTYGKNKNLDIKNGLIMMASVLVFTILGELAVLAPSQCGLRRQFLYYDLYYGCPFSCKPHNKDHIKDG